MNETPGNNNQQETNDNDRSSSNRAISGQQATPNAPPARQPRPVRPNIRRHGVIVAPNDGGQTGAINSGAAPPLGGASIELNVLPARGAGGSGGGVVPPKRPAYLPARYDAYSPRHAGPPGAPASKPNRYSWAQMQHWYAANQSGAAGDHGFQHHFSTAAQRMGGVLVLNPTQIVNLSEHTKSSLIKFIEAVKRFSEKWFSHVLLLLFLAVYACFGAYIFITFEAPTEQWEKQLIIDARQRLVNESWDEARERTREEFSDRFRGKFEEYERLLNRACASGMTSTSLENQWNFWGALFYSMTVFTTIGYGHLTPITFAGRVATMVYAIFGIPILLMVLADLGKLLTRFIKYVFIKIRYLINKLLRRKSSVRTRKLISDNTNQYIGVARDAFERGFAHIQPYNRIPQAFRPGSSLRRKKMHRKTNNSDIIDQNGEPTTTTNDPPPPDIIGGGNNSNQQPATKTRTASVSTEVIVTPGKQTKPVSPQPGEKKSLADQRDHRDHHSQTHHGHHHRAHSPGVQTKARRTSANSPSGSKKNTKGSVSRSSSSSIVAQNNGGEKTAQKPAHQQSGAKGPDQGAAGDCERTAVEVEKITTETISELETPEDQLVADELVEFDDIDDEFDIPVTFALFLLVTYMMFGAIIFSMWEGWHFFDSLYFVFISMSTIGFGDLVPQHPKRMIGTFIYLLFGLALTSMCINVVQEKIHATFLRAKMQIGEKMGLDLEQIMADDYDYDGSMEGYGEEDSNSVTHSQTNSSSAHMGPDGNNIHQQVEGYHPSSTGKAGQTNDASSTTTAPGTGSGAASGSHHHSSEAAGVKQSKSRDNSLKQQQQQQLASKKRTVAGLPGHSSSNSSWGSFRRKPSKKQLSRQVTPSGGSVGGSQSSTTTTNPANISHVIEPLAQTTQSTPNSPTSPSSPIAQQPQQSPPSQPQPAQVQPIKPELEILRKTEPLTIDPPGINQQVVSSYRQTLKGICEPLQKRFKIPTPSGPKHAVVEQQQQLINKTISSAAAADHTTTNTFGTNTGVDGLSLGKAKLGATRSQPPVSAVIKSLSSEPLRAELGTTSSLKLNKQNNQYNQQGGKSAGSSPRRSSVSHELSQLDDLIVALSQSPTERFGPLLGIPSSGRSSRSNSPTNLARRGTSMTNRPSQDPMSGSSVKKKRSLMGQHYSPATTMYMPESDSKAALAELEAIKFSAV